MIQSIYLDTSVFGGYFDTEFSSPTVLFFERIFEEKISVIISEMLLSELEKAPAKVRDLLNLIPEAQIKNVVIDTEVEFLAQSYIKEKVVGKTSYADCLHIALPTKSHATVLASWNFKHIVNIDRIRGYNAVNLKLGLSIFGYIFSFRITEL